MKIKRFVLPALIILVLALAVISITNPSTNLATGNFVRDLNGNENPVVIEESSFYFNAGKIAGKPHDGTFEVWDAKVYTLDGEVVGLEGVAQVNSVRTDSSRLDSHLQNDDFFDAENYPEIRFTSTNVDLENSKVVGFLEYAGKQKEITADIVSIEDRKITGSLVIDGNELDFKFGALITDITMEFELVY